MAGRIGAEFIDWASTLNLALEVVEKKHRITASLLRGDSLVPETVAAMDKAIGGLVVIALQFEFENNVYDAEPTTFSLQILQNTQKTNSASRKLEYQELADKSELINPRAVVYLALLGWIQSHRLTEDGVGGLVQFENRSVAISDFRFTLKSPRDTSGRLVKHR